ncbi:MAG TPA: JAB domain-containing protein [Bacillota bacterium]|nr:JAB domain-containing protein [Bacillota bacterium]
MITSRLRVIGEVLNIRLLDHFIIGEKSYFSLKEKGLL